MFIIFFLDTIKISNHVPQGLLTGPLNTPLTLYIEQIQMYICFTKRWRLVTSVRQIYLT